MVKSLNLPVVIILLTVFLILPLLRHDTDTDMLRVSLLLQVIPVQNVLSLKPAELFLLDNLMK